MSNVSGAVALIGNTFQAFSPLRHPCSHDCAIPALTIAPSLLSPLRHPYSHHCAIATLTTVPSRLSPLCHSCSLSNVYARNVHFCSLSGDVVAKLSETLSERAQRYFFPFGRSIRKFGWGMHRKLLDQSLLSSAQRGPNKWLSRFPMEMTVRENQEFRFGYFFNFFLRVYRHK